MCYIGFYLLIMKHIWWMYQIEKNKASNEFIIVLSFWSWHFEQKFRKWNVWLCIQYPGGWRLQGIYHFFSFHTLNSYLISFKKSLIVFLCYWTSSHLINNVTTYSTTGLKISLKVLKQFTEKDVPTRVDHSCWTWNLPTFCTVRND